MLKLDSFVFNPFAENTYIVYDDTTLECVIIDAGCSNKAEEDQLLGFVDSHRLKPLMVVSTHGHVDHIIGNEAVKKRYGIKLAAHPDTQPDFIQAKRHGAWLGLSPNGEFPLPDIDLKDGEIIKIGESTLEVICTPGHARGSISLYAEIEGWVFTGDARTSS